MAPCCSHLDRPLALLLADHVGEVQRWSCWLLRHRWRRRHRTRAAAQDVEQVGEVGSTGDTQPFDQRRFAELPRRNDHPSEAASDDSKKGRQQPPHRPDAAVEPEFAEQCHAFQRRRIEAPCGSGHGCGDGEVVVGTGLGQGGR